LFYRVEHFFRRGINSHFAVIDIATFVFDGFWYFSFIIPNALDVGRMCLLKSLFGSRIKVN